MRILILAATPFELNPLQAYLTEHYKKNEEGVFLSSNLEITIHISGVGLVQTAFKLGGLLVAENYDLAINAGIAGAFNRTLKLGEVVEVSKERFGDLGAEDANGNFLDLFELNLAGANEFPYTNGWLENTSLNKIPFLKNVSGISVNRVHGMESNIAEIEKKYTPDIESMEGAAFFMACLVKEIPFIEIRSISNYVEARNKENWKIKEAIESLNTCLINYIETFA